MLGTILSLADGLRWGCPKQPGLVFQTKKKLRFLLRVDANGHPTFYLLRRTGVICSYSFTFFQCFLRNYDNETNTINSYTMVVIRNQYRRGSLM